MGGNKLSYYLSLWITGCLLLTGYLGFGQRTVVHGEVRDASTGEALPFVNLAFKGTKTGATTDMDGKFSISTYYASDTLVASSVGYKPKSLFIDLDNEQTVLFELEPGEIALQEVVVEYKGNPAELILEKVIRNKEANNREKLDSYEYQVYNKVEFDLNNITDKLKERRIMKNFQFIFDYVEENEIERPFDLAVKSVVNKSGLKVFVIQSIDRKMSIEDIARSKGKETEDIFNEIESIVASGTRVNVDYIIDGLLDKDYQEEIIDYFKDSESDSLEEAIEEFDNTYSEEELRLMRIKFLSEVGN